MKTTKIKTILRYVAITALSLLSTAVNSAAYRFDWNYNGRTTTGFFTGTENGNLITNTTLSSLLLDNTVIAPIGGVWYSSSFDSSNQPTTLNGQLSFDGEENNVIFSNTDYPTNANRLQWFASFSTSTYTNQRGLASTELVILPTFIINDTNFDYPVAPDVTGWSVTRVGQVPEPSVLLLIASGLASLRCFRRRLL
ncbi:PEP-CTERM sorting domain-containing protein [Methylomonas sp. HW2-6]|uniref:PEP-CTERM sorting domain-containing protein n=1 Tax=Methylomonas sp. HW2-6 TaxID=3376687 RepID=UPI0040415854